MKVILVTSYLKSRGGVARYVSGFADYLASKNDEVIIPNFTIISNALAVIKQNAKPVLIDCDMKTWNIKLNDLEKKITKKTKAIIITHIYSYSNDMDKIIKICKKNKILLIEDAAEVIGLKYKNK